MMNNGKGDIWMGGGFTAIGAGGLTFFDLASLLLVALNILIALLGIFLMWIRIRKIRNEE